MAEDKILGLKFYYWGPYVAEIKVDPDYCKRLMATGKKLTRSLAKNLAGQIKDERLFEVEDMEFGNLIFFLEGGKINHVGFVIDESRIIHCSGKVKIESLKLHDDNFNKELFEKDHMVMSIKNLLNNLC